MITAVNVLMHFRGKQPLLAFLPLAYFGPQYDYLHVIIIVIIIIICITTVSSVFAVGDTAVPQTKQIQIHMLYCVYVTCYVQNKAPLTSSAFVRGRLYIYLFIILWYLYASTTNL